MAELDKERSKDDDDKSTTSSVGFFNNIMEQTVATATIKEKEAPTEDCANDLSNLSANKQKYEKVSGSSRPSSENTNTNQQTTTSSSNEEKESNKRHTNNVSNSVLQHLDAILDRDKGTPVHQSSFVPFAEDATSLDYVTKIDSRNSKMGSLQSAMRQSDLSVRGMSLHRLNSGRDGLLNMISPQQRAGDPGLMLLESGNLTGALFERLSEFHSTANNAESFWRLYQDSSRDETQSSKSKNDSSEKCSNSPFPSRTHPIDYFLAASGKAGEQSQKSFLNAIAETERSLAAIHDWDRSQGLRKCHSRTVVKTRRSRAKIKAFLLGMDPPPEPKKHRKRSQHSDNETTEPKKIKRAKKMAIDAGREQ